MKRALILGIGGMDGSYLADILLARGDAVAGLYRHSSCDNLARIAHVRDRITLFRGEMLEYESVCAAVRDFGPEEIYNVADQDNVGWSRAVPHYQKAVTADAVNDLLTFVIARPVRVFQPLSCTMFGSADPPQNEDAELAPASPYAVWKTRAWSHCRQHRKRGLFVSCGIMFNHDSPRRGAGYLLQDVCRQVDAVRRGRANEIVVGSEDTRVDVGHAREYMEAAVAMLQQPGPGDYCIGTGQAWTIGEIIQYATRRAGVPQEAYTVRADPARVTAGQPSYRANISRARWDLDFDPSGPGLVINEILQHLEAQPQL